MRRWHRLHDPPVSKASHSDRTPSLFDFLKVAILTKIMSMPDWPSTRAMTWS